MSATAGSRLILLMSASLDGFLARAPGEMDWLAEPGEAADRAGEARHGANLELIGQVGEIVLGRGAYDEMAPAWSSSESPMARRINALPKLVFSKTELEFEWENARRTGRPVEEEIAERKRAGEGDIVCFGGARFAHSLARHRLIDEYRLTVHPVALGEGLPLWHGLPEPQRFAPIATTAYPDGVVTHVLAAKTEGEN
ncbi:MAG TPA: dihydrofolate reductase family protein [Solirubrobacterales bacterium]|nr:dihydrofolate reductase family protein [Solirubrobacterales bacterium]